MAGVRQFDEADVADALMHAFWRLGYKAATMSDLAEATGVLRGSLYNAYRDKERMLLLALDRYAERQRAPVIEALARPTITDAIAGFLDAHLARMTDAANPSGCLMCQTALECGGRGDVIAEAVRKHFQRTEDALAERLQKGAGELPASAEPRDLARYFLGVSRGMAVLHRAYGNLDAPRATAATALTVLG